MRAEVAAKVRVLSRSRLGSSRVSVTEGVPGGAAVEDRRAIRWRQQKHRAGEEPESTYCSGGHRSVFLWILSFTGVLEQTGASGINSPDPGVRWLRARRNLTEP